MRRISGVVVLVLGIVLVAAAGIVRWSAAPALTVLPSDTHTTRVYTGTAVAVMNPTLLTGTLFGPAVLRDQPATVLHRVDVLGTHGSNALVADRKSVSLPGATVADMTARYAVDRKDLARGSGFSNVVAQTGVTFNWPIGTGKHDYTGWVSDTRGTTTLHYAGTATRGGIQTYVFTAQIPQTRIVDPQLLKALPASMSKSALARLAPSLGLTTGQLKQLNATLQKLPDPVPFGYTYSATSTFWVAPDSGLVVDVRSHEVRSAAFSLGGVLVPVAPVLDLTYTSPPSTLQAAVSDAKDKTAQMTMITTTVPLASLVAGLALVLVGAGLLTIRRQTTATPPPVPSEEREPMPVG